MMVPYNIKTTVYSYLDEAWITTIISRIKTENIRLDARYQELGTQDRYIWRTVRCTPPSSSFICPDIPPIAQGDVRWRS